ncbi:MAG: CvpA family protein [Chloroflexota bacterium]|nr:CvpA family protein [Chloroflexota bacterium]
MNVVDILIVGASGLAVLTGLRSGFLAGAYGLASWGAALLGAIAFQGPLTQRVAAVVTWPPSLVRAAVFVALVIVLELLFALCARLVIVPLRRRLQRVRALALADRALGVVPAVVRTLLVAAVMLVALLLMPVGNDVRATIDASRLARVLIAQVAVVQPLVDELVGTGPGAPLLVTRLAADDRQTLDLPADLALDLDPESERQLVALTNVERVAGGLAPLELDPRLIPVARGHAAEMLRLRYFAHVSPVTGSPFDRLGAAKITYTRAGENLAYARSVITAHRGLMDSPGHRANIMRPEFTRIGVGVIASGPNGRMFAQLFLTPE